MIVPLKVELPSTFRVVSKSTAPVTVRLSVIFVAPLTSNVPSTAVLPVAPATVNLLVLMIREPSIVTPAEVVKLVAEIVVNVVCPVTFNVPPKAPLPVAPFKVIVVPALGPMNRSEPTYTSSSTVKPP